MLLFFVHLRVFGSKETVRNSAHFPPIKDGYLPFAEPLLFTRLQDKTLQTINIGRGNLTLTKMMAPGGLRAPIHVASNLVVRANAPQTDVGGQGQH